MLLLVEIVVSQESHSTKIVTQEVMLEGLILGGLCVITAVSLDM